VQEFAEMDAADSNKEEAPSDTEEMTGVDSDDLEEQDSRSVSLDDAAEDDVADMLALDAEDDGEAVLESDGGEDSDDEVVEVSPTFLYYRFVLKRIGFRLLLSSDTVD
jgi:hypothetical protein